MFLRAENVPSRIQLFPRENLNPRRCGSCFQKIFPNLSFFKICLSMLTKNLIKPVVCWWFVCLAGQGGGQKWWKTIMFYCVSMNLRSELLRFHWFYVYFSILVRFWPGHKSKKSLFYCRNVMFWAHPGSPKGGSRGASGRPFWDPQKLQKQCLCCVFGDGDPKKHIKPAVFNKLCLGTLPGGTFH